MCNEDRYKGAATDEDHFVAQHTRTLLNVMNRSGDIDELLQTAYEILGNPIILIDVSFSLIAHAGGEQVIDEPLWVNLVNTGFAGDQYIDAAMSKKVSQDSISGPFIEDRELETHDQIIGKIRQSGTPLGYMKLIQYHKEISSSDKALFKILCDLTSVLMYNFNQRRYLDNPQNEAFMYSLLKGTVGDNLSLKSMMRRLRIRLDSFLNLVIIELNPLLSELPEKFYLFQRKVQDVFGRSMAVSFQEYIVVLYDADSENAFRSSEEIRDLSRLLKRYNCRAGISPVFTIPQDMPRQFELAARALSLARTLKDDGFIFFYEDYAIEDMILLYYDAARTEYLISPVIKLLSDIDREKESDYVKTLLTYTRCRMSISETARTLHIHHNTLKYRLDKIRELTELDFSDKDAVFRILLTDRIQDIMNRIRNEV